MRKRIHRLGKYQLTKKIGEGAFSVVWKARDTIEGVDVAVKVPHDSLAHEDVKSEFVSEARIAAELVHPNILRLKNADYIDGKFVLVYELGQCSLDDRMHRRMPVATALSVVRQILEGLSFAHHNGVVHRDIKPENIIVFPGSQVRLADFGVSKSTRKTIATDNPVGTLGYMAPEQAYGRGSFSADTFSVGILMHEMITRQQPDWPFKWPFKGHHSLVARLGDPFVNFIRHATAFEPRNRFQHAGEMLDHFLQCEQVLAAVA